MKKAKIRPLGDITADLEVLYFEMLSGHDMQPHEVIGLFLAWQRMHMPEATEVFVEDDSEPVFYFGHKGGLK